MAFWLIMGVVTFGSVIWALRSLHALNRLTDQAEFDHNESRRLRGRAFLAMGIFECAIGVYLVGSGNGNIGSAPVLVGLAFFVIAYFHRDGTRWER